MVTGALLPRLRPLDEKVLAALSRDRGLRASRVAQLVHGQHAYACDHCDGARRPRNPTKFEAHSATVCFTRLGDGERCAGLRIPVLVTTPGQAREVRQILRGLEAVGLASCRGGWWRLA